MLRHYEICNENFNIDLVGQDDFFICSLGPEDRSYYLLNQIAKTIIERDHILALATFEWEEVCKEVKQTVDIANISIMDATNFAATDVIAQVKRWIDSHAISEDEFKLHIDYSSMPQNWYCDLLMSLEKIVPVECTTFFWYTEGEYADISDEYPSAGIESFSLVSGAAPLGNTDRTHVIAMGYDKFRTQAIISVLDPNRFILCAAYDSNEQVVLKNIRTINARIIPQASLCTYLPINNFEFMLAKLREIAQENYKNGGVVFVPDGPKPLILAMSIVPEFFSEPGVTCLQIKHNEKIYKPHNVQANQRILGFCVKIKA